MATQQERKAETRQRLLDAAAELFAAKGVHAVSLEAVADAADRTTGAIYAHFGSKAGLLMAVIDETSREVARQTRGALADAGDTDARLDTLWRTFAARAEAPEDPWMLLEHELWLHAARHPDARDQLAERFRVTRERMGESWQQWASDADIELPEPGDQLAVLVLALLYGLDMQRRVEPAAVPDSLALDGLRLLFALAPAVDTESTTRPPTENRHTKEKAHAHRAL